MAEAEARLQAAIARLERAAEGVRQRGGGDAGEVAALKADCERLSAALAAAEAARAALAKANAEATRRVEAAIARLAEGLRE